MIDQFQKFISKNIALKVDEKFLLAVSGGLDSMVLCDLFLKSKLKFAIAHCNFQLRGNESIDDALFVRAFAEKNKIVFHSRKFNIKAFAKEKGLSTQMAARQFRYNWFEELCLNHNYDYIVTAHHQTDVLETMMINLIRGTGLSGLHGILPLQKNIFRPLLFATRKEIETYASKNKIAWREDASNATDDYMRNKIRHKILPMMQSLNTSVEKTFFENAQRIYKEELLIEDLFEKIKPQLVEVNNDAVKLKVDFLKNSGSVEALLFHALKDYGFKNEQIETIASLLFKQSGKKVVSATHELKRDRNYLIVSPKGKKDFETHLIKKNVTELILENFTIQFEQIKAAEIPGLKTDKNIALLDAGRLKFPLTLRTWKPGDSFEPLGMKGKKKKLSDYFTDKKISNATKDDRLVLLSNGDIVWLVNERTDERYKVTNHTETILKITFTKSKTIEHQT